jgi:hypothetical protein
MLDGVDELVCQQIVAAWRFRAPVAGREEDVLPEGKRLGPELARLGHVRVQSHAAEIVAEAGFELGPYRGIESSSRSPPRAVHDLFQASGCRRPRLGFGRLEEQSLRRGSPSQ